MEIPDLVLDPQLRLWVLFPIMLVMLLFGYLRHYATILITSKPSTPDVKTLREQQWLLYAQNLRVNGAVNLSNEAFVHRQGYYAKYLKEGRFLKDPDAAANAAGQAPNLTDPANMEGMMGMMKQQALNFVPQTLMMSWVNAMFSGFILSKFPFSFFICIIANINDQLPTIEYQLLTNPFFSETSFPFDDQIQADAPVWCRY